MNFHDHFFSWVCGQAIDRSWVFDGHTFPLCERCTGIYAGAAVVAVMLFCFRWRMNGWMKAANTLFMLQIIPFGLHLWPDTPMLRTLSGAWFSVGLIGLLGCRLPFRQESMRRGWFGLACSILFTSLLALLAATSSVISGVALAGLASLGLVFILVLIGWNIVLCFASLKIHKSALAQ